jgi:hypothetical protein
MDNPFVGLKMKNVREELLAPGVEQERNGWMEQRRQKRDAIYNTYSPMVDAILDDLIAATLPGDWKKGSDCAHLYCCHVCWYAGPAEKFHVAYDERHDIRRMIEITLEQDDDCNPVGFRISSHENIHRSVHVGLTREDLIRGVQQVFA